jgi:nucleoside-diphosphate-sugar epimerase
MKVLVTGVAGFIGMHCAKRLAVNFAPSTSLDAGLARFAAWFKSYHRLG